MVFIASKLLGFAIEPLFWVLLLLTAGLVLQRWRPRPGRALAWSALGVLLLSGWTTIPELLLQRLEHRYPPPPPNADMQRYVGVVILGGALAHSYIWTAHGRVALNEQAERMTEAVSLARKYPHLKLLFSGGDASLQPDTLTEAERARQYFDEMGVEPARLLYEAKSRNTFENAYYSATLPGVDRSQPWLLLTSAFHMPRSMGVFLKTGWNVTPFPVDYRTSGPQPNFDFSLHDGPRLWHLAAHETLGYLVYRWRGML